MILLYIIPGLMALILVAAALLSKSFHVSAETVINKPADSKVKLDYQGTDGTVGFISSWSSKNKNVGVGRSKSTDPVWNVSDGNLSCWNPFSLLSAALLRKKGIFILPKPLTSIN